MVWLYRSRCYPGRCGRLAGILYTIVRGWKLLHSYGRATTQYVVASKACKNPEAAFKIVNYLIENQQKWVDEGVSTTEMVTSDFYPLYNTYDNADEIEVSYDVLTKYLAGEITMDDVDFSTHKLLKSDMEAVTKLKKEPYDDFSLDKWNLDSDIAKNNLPRLVSILVGDAPSVNDKYVPVYNAYNGQTETMETNGYADLITEALGPKWRPIRGNEHCMHINKISAKMQDGCDADQACRELSPYYDVIHHENNAFVGTTVELVPKGCNKAVGIAAVCRSFGIEWEDTVVFGDSNNDLSMFEYAATKVAMGNGSPKIRELADYVTTDMFHYGIQNGLTKLGLI